MAKKVLTQFAAHANTIADTFRAAFVKTPLGGCTVDMTAPEESTQGGRLGLQVIVLRPQAEKAALSIVVGTLHGVEKRAELRSYATVSKMYEGRFKTAPPFSAEDYQKFIERAEPILSAFSLEVVTTDVLVEPPRANDPTAEHLTSLPPLAKKTIASWILFLVAFLAIAIGALVWAKTQL